MVSTIQWAIKVMTPAFMPFWWKLGVMTFVAHCTFWRSFLWFRSCQLVILHRILEWKLVRTSHKRNAKPFKGRFKLVTARPLWPSIICLDHINKSVFAKLIFRSEASFSYKSQRNWFWGRFCWVWRAFRERRERLAVAPPTVISLTSI